MLQNKISGSSIRIRSHFIVTIADAREMFLNDNDKDTFFYKFIKFIENKEYNNLIILLDEHFNEKIQLCHYVEDNNLTHNLDILSIIYNSFGKDIGLKIIERLYDMLNKDELMKLFRNITQHSPFDFYLFVAKRIGIADIEIIMKFFGMSMRCDTIENFKKVITVFPLNETEMSVQDVLFLCERHNIYDIIKFFIENGYEDELKTPIKNDEETSRIILREILKHEGIISNNEPSEFFKFMCENKFYFMKMEDYELHMLFYMSPKHAEFIYNQYPFLTTEFAIIISNIQNPSLFNSENYLNFIKKIMLENSKNLLFENYVILCKFPTLFSFAIEENIINLDITLSTFIKNDNLEKIPYIDHFINSKCTYDEKYENETCSYIELRKVKTYLVGEDFYVILNNVIKNFCKFYNDKSNNSNYFSFIMILTDNYFTIEQSDDIFTIIKEHLRKYFLKLSKFDSFAFYDLFGNDTLIKLLFENDIINISDAIHEFDCQTWTVGYFNCICTLLEKTFKLYPKKFSDMDPIYLDDDIGPAITLCNRLKIRFEINKSHDK